MKCIFLHRGNSSQKLKALRVKQEFKTRIKIDPQGLGINQVLETQETMNKAAMINSTIKW